MSTHSSDTDKVNPLRGFTLMETLLVIGLFVLLLAALIGLYQAYGTLFTAEQGRFVLGNTANTAVTEIEQAVLQANRILASRTISGTTYTTGSNTLVLELSSVDAGGAVISGTFDHVVFYVSGTSLYRLSEPDPASSRQSGVKQLSDTLSALTLSYNAVDVTMASSVTVDITLQTLSGHGTFQFHLQQQTYLRNK